MVKHMQYFTIIFYILNCFNYLHNEKTLHETNKHQVAQI